MKWVKFRIKTVTEAEDIIIKKRVSKPMKH